MRLRGPRVLVPVVAVAAVAATLVPAAAAPSDPAGTLQVTPTGPSVFTDTLGALAGSSQYAVLITHHQSVERPPAWQFGDLVSRAADGTTTDMVDPQYDLTSYSLVDSTFSSVVDGDLGQVDWWDLAAGTHGRVTLPTGEEYLTGAPGGFLVRDGQRLLRESTTGAVTDLGTPDPDSSTFSATAGDTGVVVSGGTAGHPALAYQAFSTPGSFTSLSIPGATSVECQTVVGDYAGCWVDDTSEVALLPVDGTRPATVTSAIETTPASPLLLAVAGSTLLWQRDAVPSGPVHSIGYGSATVQSSTAVDDPVSAYGAALAGSATPPRVVRITSATSTPTLVATVPASPVAASALSLSPGRLVDNDDRRTSGSTATTSTFSTEVSTSASTLRVGATGAVHKNTDPQAVTGSGTTTVYIPPAKIAAARVVRTPRGSTTLRDVAGDRWFASEQVSTSVSGNRVVYAVSSPRKAPSAFVFDASTGRRTLVQREVSYALPVVFGDVVVSLHADSSVWWRNLVTGASQQVSGPIARNLLGAQLFAWGDYVAWDITTGNGGDGDPSYVDRSVRNVRTMGPATAVSLPIQQLSSAGLVLDSSTVVDGRRADSYSLQTYGGTTVPLLPSGQYAVAPQVEGRTVAWADAAGALKVAPVAVSPAAPRYLGAPLGPAAIASPGRAGWRVYAPYSAPLTSCRVEVLRGTRVVRRLACDAARMRVGVAEFAWDGTYGGHKAHAGTYRWRIVSAGDGGASLNENGARRPVTHPVAVGHPTRVVLRAPARVRRGSAAVLSAHLTTLPRSHDRHRNVSFYRRLASGSWHRVATVKTSGVGTARLRVRPGATARYRASFTGNVVDRPATSRAVVVRVR